jgi:hypothetical protein
MKTRLLISFSPLLALIETTACYAIAFKPVSSFDSSFLNSADFCDTNSPQKYCSSYSVQENGWGTLTVKTKQLQSIDLPTTNSSVLQVLQNSPWAKSSNYQWSFQPAKTSLQGYLEILHYKPVVRRRNDIKGVALTANGTQVSEPDFAGKLFFNGAIGANFRAKFVPGAGDPQPLGASSNNKFHWIQLISSNHGAIVYKFPGNINKSKSSYGMQDLNKIDVIEEQKDTQYVGAVVSGNPFAKVFSPYYDTIYNNISQIDEFFDLPYRSSEVEKPHEWSAELYLVEEYEPNKVNIYDGIRWGWSSSFTKDTQAALPEDIPSSGSPTPPKRPQTICAPGWPITCCIAWGHWGDDYSSNGVINKGTLSLDPEFQDNSIYENNAITDPTAVPTPALLPTLATAGIYHGRKWRKRKQTRKDNDIAA